MHRTLTLIPVLAAAGALAAPVLGQADPLQFKVPAGTRRVFQRTARTDVEVRAGENTSRRVMEVSARREILIIETKDNPPQLRRVTLETPSGERLVAYEENGKDRLSEVPEARRLRAMPPLLSAHWLDATARPIEAPPDPQQPMQAIDRAIAEFRYLPEKPVGPDTPQTRDVNLGIARLQITTQQVPAEGEGEAPAVVLQATARLTFTGDVADRITVTRLEARTAWAKDGSGLLSQRGTLVLDEKAGQATQHLTRTWEERFQETGRLAPAALAKAKENLEALEKAMADARAGNLDASVEALQAYINTNPDGTWTAAVRSLHAALAQRRLVAQPVKPARLRLMLRDLQSSRDRAGAGGDRARMAQIDAALQQIAHVNAKQILTDAADPDPIIRDLATFALAFLDDPQAADRLIAMAGDTSGQVRGTALVSLAIRGDKVGKDLLLARLGDEEARVRGAAALLAERTLQRGEENVQAILPTLLKVLSADMPWARTNAASAIANLAPKGSAPAARALVEAHQKESEDRIKPVYLAALKEVTGVDADKIEPYQAWLKEKG